MKCTASLRSLENEDRCLSPAMDSRGGIAMTLSKGGQDEPPSANHFIYTFAQQRHLKDTSLPAEMMYPYLALIIEK
jgi:hypothetical protein